MGGEGIWRWKVRADSGSKSRGYGRGGGGDDKTVVAPPPPDRAGHHYAAERRLPACGSSTLILTGLAACCVWHRSGCESWVGWFRWMVMGSGAGTQEGDASDACASHAVLQEGRWTVAWSEYLGRVCDLEVERRVCSVSCFSPTLIIKK